ncbi:MAG: exopolysaccharide biosynthesis protein [Rhodoferax sp.]|nr:exopolysaccharide biosynthesis protein [Rhodoferax sp.]MCF8211024.1 exopolysaccharide biosynthesis protein [Rhodoferax sp.]
MSRPLAQRLREAADGHRAGAADSANLRLDLYALLRLHGESSSVVLMMLLAVMSVLPLAGAGTVMSLGIWAVAWAWARERDDCILPKRLGSMTLNERWSGRCLHSLAWMYEQSNRWLRPRWALWSHARTRAWWGVWAALMGLVIFLPLPLGNVLPSLSLILLSLGWMFRDGLALLLSAASGLAAVAYGVSLWHLMALGMEHLWARLPV